MDRIPARVLIHGGETAYHVQYVRSVLDALKEAGVDHLHLQPKQSLPTEIEGRVRKRIVDVTWKYLKRAPNTFDPEAYHWKGMLDGAAFTRREGAWVGPRGPFRAPLPFRPDLVLTTAPYWGHVLYKVIPWANAEGIPVLSIDHGAPLLPLHWGGYRGAMWGCAANACWGQVSAAINIGYGAPATGQIVTGSPTLDDLTALAEDEGLKTRLGLDPTKRMILLMSTHTEPLKSAMDRTMRQVIERHGGDEELEVVIKPHPQELLRGTLIDVPDTVRVVRTQEDLHAWIAAADCIVSPATSVLIPALALRRPFVNLLGPDSGLGEPEALAALHDLIGDAVLPMEALDGAIRGEVTVEQAALDRVFERIGFRSDGRNGRRVLDLGAHLVEGGAPEAWVAP